VLIYFIQQIEEEETWQESPDTGTIIADALQLLHVCYLCTQQQC
jgi:hypothetical protein